MAEGVGFEPTDLAVIPFQAGRLQPLGHPSENERRQGQGDPTAKDPSPVRPFPTSVQPTGAAAPPARTPEPLSVWAYSTGALGAGRYRMLARRAWKASQLLMDEISR